MFKFLLGTKFLLGAGAIACILAGVAGYKVGTFFAERTLHMVEQELSAVKLEYANFISQAAIDIANANNAALQEHTRLSLRIAELEGQLYTEREERSRESYQLTQELRRAKETGEGDDTIGTAMYNYLSLLSYYQQRYGPPGGNQDSANLPPSTLRPAIVSP